MPLTPATLGFKFQIRLMDLSPEHCVEFTCPECQHTRRVATYQLHLKFPSAFKLEDTAARFRCSACGFSASNTLRARWAVYLAKPPVTEV